MTNKEPFQKQTSDRSTSKGKRLWNWFDRRVGIDQLLHTALDEPIPGGARFAYIFGSALLFLFLSQIVTGVVLALYYVPSADHAHTTVSYIMKEVSSGSFIRSLHAYGSSAAIIVLLLHIAQTFLYGSYKGRRELLWISGCVLAVLMLGLAFTGYLLPWDQKAYFATAVGTNIVSEVPLVGSWLKSLMRGGNEMGTLTISRFFVAHVFLLPALVFGFVATHVYLFRKAGAAGPPVEDPVKPKLPSERFYPRQVVMDMVCAMLLIVALGFLSYFVPVEIGPKANPSDTQYVPRPEWYYLPAFQWLKYWNGSFAFIGIIVIPTLVSILFVGLPFIDRALERRPYRRPLAMTFFVGGIFCIVGLGFLSYRDDHRDPSIAIQLDKQRKETETFMLSSFDPQIIPFGSTKAVLSTPQINNGAKIYEDKSCSACHGDNGTGTSAGAALTGIKTKYSAEKLTMLLKHPTTEMIEGGMEPLDISETDMAALVNYLQSLGE